MNIRVEKRTTTVVTQDITIEADQIIEIVKDWAKSNLDISDNAKLEAMASYSMFEGIEITDTTTELV